MDLLKRTPRYSAGEFIRCLDHFPTRNTPTKIDAIPNIIAMTTETIPDLYATPPHTTKVLAENSLILVDNPDRHHEEFLPATNISLALFIFLPKKPPNNNSPAKYNRIMM